jgi:transposase InsO family protein
LAKIEAITSLNQVWQTDITYVRTDEGWLYLAMVMDAFSNRIIGWAFSSDLGTQFVVDALLMAVNHRGGRAARQVVLHSDRGVQYSSARFRSQLAEHEILNGSRPFTIYVAVIPPSEGSRRLTSNIN